MSGDFRTDQTHAESLARPHTADNSRHSSSTAAASLSVSDSDRPCGSESEPRPGPKPTEAGDSASDTVTVTDRWAAGTSDSSTGPAHWKPTSQSPGAFGALGLAVSRITAITRDSS